MPTKQVTIADSGTVSGAVKLFDDYDNAPESLVGIICAAGFATANLTFQASVDGTNYYTMYNAAGAVVTVFSAAASEWIALDPADFAGVPYLKVVSSATQSGGDVLTLVTRRL